MKLVLARGPNLNKWEMQNYEPLMDMGYYIRGITSKRHIYNVSDIKFPVVKLPLLAELGKNIPRFNSFVHHLFGDHECFLGFQKAVEGADIVHTAETFNQYSAQAVNAKRENGHKVVVTCWENIPFQREYYPGYKKVKETVRQGADLFLAVTERSRLSLLLEGVPDNKIRVLPVGIDLQKFCPSDKDVSLLKSLKLEENDFIVLSITRQIREKGLQELLYAARMIIPRLPESERKRLRFVMVGKGPLHNRLIELTQRLGIQDHVCLIPEVPYSQIPAMHNLSDIFVLPSLPTRSWQEQFGMVLIEAMACGKPVISTLSGSIPEVVGDAGILVQPADAVDLANALRELISSPELRKKLSSIGITRARNHYDCKIFAEKIDSIYHSL